MSIASTLKLLADLGQHSLVGLEKVTFHYQLCVLTMLLTSQADANMHRFEQKCAVMNMELCADILKALKTKSAIWICYLTKAQD